MVEKGSVSLAEHFKGTRKVRPSRAEWPIPTSFGVVVFFERRIGDGWEALSAVPLDMDKGGFLGDLRKAGDTSFDEAGVIVTQEELGKKFAPKIIKIVGAATRTTRLGFA